MKRAIHILFAVLTLAVSIKPALAVERESIWIFTVVVFDPESAIVDHTTIGQGSAAECDKKRDEVRALLEGGALKAGYTFSMSACTPVEKPSKFKKERDS